MAGKKTSTRRARSIQVAALPLRRGRRGRLEVLLLTSRETRRWIIPKGWRADGLKDHEAAEREAREEAGLVGRIKKKPLGSYAAWKRTADSFQMVTVRVFRLDVEAQLDSWEEIGQRDLRWVPLKDAVTLVDEPGLSVLLQSLLDSASLDRGS